MRTLQTYSLVLMAAFLMLLPRCAHAGDGGSAYSLLGIGDLRYWPNARSAGMGFTGLAIPGQSSINAYSPASWSRINRTRLEAGALYEGFNSTDGNNSRYLARIDFNGLMLGIPISQADGVVFVAGLTPFSRVNYDAYGTGSFISPTDTMNYVVHYVGSGGISRGFAGFSYAPWFDLSLGFSVNYLFGSRDQSRELIPKSIVYSGSTEEESNSVSGLTYSIGALYNGFGSIAPGLRQLSLAVFATSRGSLGTHNQTIYHFAPNVTATELDTTTVQTGDLAVPFSFGAGLAYLLGDRYVVAADYVAEPWQMSEFNGAPIEGVRNGYRIGIGFERLSGRELSQSWGDRSSFRFGAYYHPTYVQVRGGGILEYGVTMGATVPLYTDPRFGTESSLVIALEYARRAPASGTPIKDTIWRCTVAFSIGERWFVRSEED